VVLQRSLAYLPESNLLSMMTAVTGNPYRESHRAFGEIQGIRAVKLKYYSGGIFVVVILDNCRSRGLPFFVRP
jgi:hypothetical protein